MAYPFAPVLQQVQWNTLDTSHTVTSYTWEKRGYIFLPLSNCRLQLQILIYPGLVLHPTNILAMHETFANGDKQAICTLTHVEVSNERQPSTLS
jgi:hypothetical protein